MEELLKEKQELEAKILAKQKEAEAATTAAYWIKKRLKVVEAEIAAMPTDESDGKAIQEISKGLQDG